MNKVRPGDPVAISAATWNEMLDAAALAKETKRRGAGIPDGLTQPGYTDRWKAAVARDNGDILESK